MRIDSKPMEIADVIYPPPLWKKPQKCMNLKVTL